MALIKGKSGPVLICLVVFSLSLMYSVFVYAGSKKVIKKSKQDIKTLVPTLLPPKGLDKINSSGQYLPFYGYSIISRVTGQYNYSVIEQFIRESKTLSKYLAPLPATYYRVTIFDVFTQRNVPEKYQPSSGNVPSQHWAQALRYLQNDLSAARKICSKVTSEFSFHKTRFNLGKNPGHGLTVQGHLTNENIVVDLRNEFLSIFPNSAEPNYEYHLSLGYLFKEIDNSDMKSINRELDNFWNLINEEYLLKAPDVYYFEIITELNPFQDLVVNEKHQREELL